MRKRAGERWKLVEEFPDYAVSNYGQVINSVTDMLKSVHVNQQGLPSILFAQDGQYQRRGLGLLVAKTFLDVPEDPRFDTVINLNGDRSDCRSENLMWRPRWFAIEYHKQFNRDQIRPTREVIDGETDEFFETTWHVAITQGVLERQVIASIYNHTPVFPYWHRYYFADESRVIIEGGE